MIVGVVFVVFGLGLLGLWIWAELESTKREDMLKERVLTLERKLAIIESRYISFND